MYAQTTHYYHNVMVGGKDRTTFGIARTDPTFWPSFPEHTYRHRPDLFHNILGLIYENYYHLNTIFQKKDINTAPLAKLESQITKEENCLDFLGENYQIWGQNTHKIGGYYLPFAVMGFATANLL